jgi:hypothetical protein
MQNKEMNLLIYSLIYHKQEKFDLLFLMFVLGV